MARPGDEHALPGGARLRFLRTAGSTGDRAFELEWRVPVGSRMVPFPHVHLTADEHFRVESGTARHWLGRRRLSARDGDAWTVPAGTAHIHPVNVGRTTLVARQWIELDVPDGALLRGFERYVETVAAFTAQGRVDRFWRNRSPLQDALTAQETLLPGTYIAGLPRSLQRAALARLAGMARRRGMTATPTA
ncbi:MAG TPA: cupin domain-containing protein [Solirubrobacteraceae bacterium]|nr:cupin domain-containing protein [Solirubrobacteraceae bacterium]